jgi:acetyltransferase-like isoleucine patch superfamily enzyme
LQLVFHNSDHHLQSLMTDLHDCPATSLKVLGEAIILRNVKLAKEILGIDTVILPKGHTKSIKLIEYSFPSIRVEQCPDNEFTISNDRMPPLYPYLLNRKYDTKIDKETSFKVPLNTFIHYPAKEQEPCLTADSFVYPWDFLRVIQKVLCDNINETVISPKASIAKSSIIEGPCIIEDDVVIDDFCKIKGPTYIGKGSFVGMSSLIRSSMLGEKTSIGFNCEIARTYFAGYAKMAHQNVILDSIIGKDVWFGGYSGTANVLLNNQNVKYEIDGNLLDTGTRHFGTVVGNNCAIGASVITLPGRHIPSNSTIQAGTIFGKKC